MGQAFLLKLSDGAKLPKYQTMAGLRVNEMSIVEGAMALKATGIMLGDKAEQAIRYNALSLAEADYELSFEDGNKLRGSLLIKRFSYAGDFNGERTYTLEAESVGAMVPA